jgi:methionine aminotransferase
MMAQKVQSKLPSIGTSIFSILARRVNETGAINLAQGFPDLPVPDGLIDRIYFHMKSGHNQYAPGDGTKELRAAITSLLDQQYGVQVSPMEEVTITSGATEALSDTFAALIHPGDEVIVLEPAYDSYVPGVLINQGIPVFVRLNDQDFSVDWDKVESSISDRTRAIIVNNPHNPSGSCLDATDMLKLESIAVKYDLLVISDEVYNHLIFDGKHHESVLRYPSLRKRSVAIFSFGKTFHATGWKVGYTVAGHEITREIRKIHQFVTFTVHTPTQLGLADYTTLDRVRTMNQQFQSKRDLLIEGLAGTPFSCVPAKGTYFQTIDYGHWSKMSDTEAVERLITEFGLATIPLSPPQINID